MTALNLTEYLYLRDICKAYIEACNAQLTTAFPAPNDRTAVGQSIIKFKWALDEFDKALTDIVRRRGKFPDEFVATLPDDWATATRRNILNLANAFLSFVAMHVRDNPILVRIDPADRTKKMQMKGFTSLFGQDRRPVFASTETGRWQLVFASERKIEGAARVMLKGFEALNPLTRAWASQIVRETDEQRIIHKKLVSFLENLYAKSAKDAGFEILSKTGSAGQRFVYPVAIKHAATDTILAQLSNIRRNVEDGVRAPDGIGKLYDPDFQFDAVPSEVEKEQPKASSLVRSDLPRSISALQDAVMSPDQCYFLDQINDKGLVNCFLDPQSTYHDHFDCTSPFEWELLRACKEFRASTGNSIDEVDFDWFKDNCLPLRSELHRRLEVSGENPLLSGTHRRIAPSIGALTAHVKNDVDVELFTVRRSTEVAFHPGLTAVIPAGVFQPHSPDTHAEFDIEEQIKREFAEEFFDFPEVHGTVIGRAYYYFHTFPPVEDLTELLKADRSGPHARIITVGQVLGLFDLRPEIAVLLWINDPQWHKRAQKGNWTPGGEIVRLKVNWEAERTPGKKSILPRVLRPTKTAAKILDENELHVRPEQMIAQGAGIFWLGVDALLNTIYPACGFVVPPLKPTE